MYGFRSAIAVNEQFILSFNKYLLGAYIVSGSVLVLKYMHEQNKHMCPHGAYILVCVGVGRETLNQIYECYKRKIKRETGLRSAGRMVVLQL